MSCTVLRCHQCGTFQVHQQKKAKKWTCKMCNEKQSFVKVYAEGSGAECRSVVQSLNMRQQEVDDDLTQGTRQADNFHQHQDNVTTMTSDNTWQQPGNTVMHSTSDQTGSKWSTFLEPEESGEYEADTDDENSYSNLEAECQQLNFTGDFQPGQGRWHKEESPSAGKAVDSSIARGTVKSLRGLQMGQNQEEHQIARCMEQHKA